MFEDMQARIENMTDAELSQLAGLIVAEQNRRDEVRQRQEDENAARDWAARGTPCR
jgi:hypothetical protein